MATLDGVEIKIGRRAFVVPPATMWIMERLSRPESYSTPESTVELIRDMLCENYPSLTGDDLLRILPATTKRLNLCLKSIVSAAMTDLEPPTGEAGSP